MVVVVVILLSRLAEVEKVCVFEKGKCDKVRRKQILQINNDIQYMEYLIVHARFILDADRCLSHDSCCSERLVNSQALIICYKQHM